MDFSVNIGKDKANMFLRALWSQIRINLGEGGWNYTPYKDGSKNLIHFGWLSASMLKESLNISIKYKQKGSITTISLESNELQQNESMRKKVEESVHNAINFHTLLNKSEVSYRVKALEIPISSYSGSNFSINPAKVNSLNIIDLSILGFDNIDVRTEAQATLNKILDILSVETQSVFSYANSDEYGEEHRVSEVETENILWYGSNRPIENGYFTISKKAKLLIERVISGEYVEYNNFLKACRLFHSAHKYNMLRYESEALDLSEQFRKLLLPNEEVAAVLYMSALEVASVNSEKPKKCELCGNPVFSISSRVLDYVQSFEANDYVVKDFYKDRSLYLHTGDFFSDQSYTGTTVPQLEASSTNGCKNQLPMKNLLDVSDVVSFCLRQQLQN